MNDGMNELCSIVFAFSILLFFVSAFYIITDPFWIIRVEHKKLYKKVNRILYSICLFFLLLTILTGYLLYKF